MFKKEETKEIIMFGLIVITFVGFIALILVNDAHKTGIFA